MLCFSDCLKIVFESWELCAWKWVVCCLSWKGSWKMSQWSWKIMSKRWKWSWKMIRWSWKINVELNVKLNVKLSIHGSVVQQVDRAPVVLALVEPSTGFCHGIADIGKVEERVRGRITVAGGKRKFHCDSCNYSTKDNYLLKRHIARIHEKTIDSKRCRFSKFSTTYCSNLSRHIQRAQGSSISCNQASNFSRS